MADGADGPFLRLLSLENVIMNVMHLNVNVPIRSSCQPRGFITAINVYLSVSDIILRDSVNTHMKMDTTDPLTVAITFFLLLFSFKLREHRHLVHGGD